MKNKQPLQAAHHAITTARRPDNTRSSALARSRSTKFMPCPSHEPRSQCSDIGFTFLPFSRRFLVCAVLYVITFTPFFKSSPECAHLSANTCKPLFMFLHATACMYVYVYVRTHVRMCVCIAHKASSKATRLFLTN